MRAIFDPKDGSYSKWSGWTGEVIQIGNPHGVDPSYVAKFIFDKSDPSFNDNTTIDGVALPHHRWFWIKEGWWLPDEIEQVKRIMERYDV